MVAVVLSLLALLLFYSYGDAAAAAANTTVDDINPALPITRNMP